MNEFKDIVAALQNSAYQQWVKSEGLPLVEGYGLEDVREVKLAPWARMGGKGAVIYLYGSEAFSGMYVAEIPPGGSLAPERHIYDEIIYIVEGIGATEVWQEGGKKHLFEWKKGSLFSPPLNSWHRLFNGGREPVRFLAVTRPPIVIQLLSLPVSLQRSLSADPLKCSAHSLRS